VWFQRLVWDLRRIVSGSDQPVFTYARVGPTEGRAMRLVDRLTADAVALELSDPSGAQLDFQPGQFVTVVQRFRQVIFQQLIPNIRGIGLLAERIRPHDKRARLAQYFVVGGDTTLSGSQIIGDLEVGT